jgi:dTDP-4-dehydrorhamnose reductase
MQKQDRNNKEKILIFGDGQIGNLYLNYFSSKKITAKITTADVTKPTSVKSAINKFKPTVVINTAAKTNLEWDANNKLETFNVNVLGVDNIASICDEKKIYFIHLSSDCILESKNEKDTKNEESVPNPISYYSWTKVWAENIMTFKRSKDFKYLILRPRQPISGNVSYKNMLVKMLTFTRFIDTPNSGTVLEDLMGWTDELIRKRVIGVVHVANEGWTTPYEIGLLLKKYILPDMPVIKISKEQLNKMTPEKRVDTILDVKKLKKLVKSVKPYNERMEETIILLGENLKNAKPSLVKDELDKTLLQSRARTIVNDVWPQLIKKS